MTHEPVSGTASQDIGDPDYRAAYESMRDGGAEALEAFETLARQRPDDPLVRLHLSRLRGGDRGDLIVLAAK